MVLPAFGALALRLPGLPSFILALLYRYGYFGAGNSGYLLIRLNNGTFGNLHRETSGRLCPKRQCCDNPMARYSP